MEGLTLMWTCLLLLHTLVEASTYTKVSYTTAGLPCLQDCINGRCRVSSTGYEDCTEGTEPAPIYYTIQSDQTDPSWVRSVCLSNCGTFGSAYNWCFIDEQDHWDICCPETHTDFVTRHITDEPFGVCEDECRTRQGDRANRGTSAKGCNVHGGSWSKCGNTQTSFIQVYTIHGQKCQSFCERTLITDGYKTCLVDGKKQKCARPASHLPKLVKLQTDLLTHLDLAGNCNKTYHGHGDLKRRKRCIFFAIDDANPNCVMDYAHRLLNTDLGVQTLPTVPRQTANVQTVANNELITGPANETHTYTVMNPIFSYTQLVSDSPYVPVLPLVVRARITPLTLRPRGIRELNGDFPAPVLRNIDLMGRVRDRYNNIDNDERGHLIGFQHGGPDAIYNVVPQTQRLNRGGAGHSMWYDTDTNINAFVRNQGGTVELTIVVIYGNINTDHPYPYRPTGFAVNEVWRNADGSFYTRNNNCNAVYYNNDPYHNHGYPERD